MLVVAAAAAGASLIPLPLVQQLLLDTTFRGENGIRRGKLFTRVSRVSKQIYLEGETFYVLIDYQQGCVSKAELENGRSQTMNGDAR